MTTQEKKNLIINMLDTHSSVTVSQLSEIFRISDVSVRKLHSRHGTGGTE